MSERELLREHGTTLIRITPAMIVQGAQHDLKLKELKRQFVPVEPTIVPIEQKPQRVVAATHQYLFHRKHVAKADDVEQLIAVALDDREIGCASAKYHTRLIYEDEELLRAALILVRNGDATADELRLFEVYKMLTAADGGENEGGADELETG
jgi:hypothetical protein